MSPAEKLACEWEARHDVLARGRWAAPSPVQSYLTHQRCEQAQRQVGSSAAAHPHGPRPAAGDRRSGASAWRSWVRWGEDAR